MQFWVIAVPVLVSFVAILGIGVWIGWTMATTPPPKPIEESPTPEETKEAENKEPTKHNPKQKADTAHANPKGIVEKIDFMLGRKNRWKNLFSDGEGGKGTIRIVKEKAYFSKQFSHRL